MAQATAPAWTPLFARASAVVTNVGSLAAHASLVAREYGIPAVVATGDATVRLLEDGQWVTIDGGAGLVEVRRYVMLAEQRGRQPPIDGRLVAGQACGSSCWWPTAVVCAVVEC